MFHYTFSLESSKKSKLIRTNCSRGAAKGDYFYKKHLQKKLKVPLENLKW